MQLRPPLALALGLSLNAAAPTLPACAATLLVPAQFATIQAAIDAALSGDVIEIAPGVYTQGLTVTGKALTLRSFFATSGDPADIEATVIDGGGADVVALGTGANVLLQGLSLRNGSGGIRVNAGATLGFSDGRVRDTSDGISLEGGSSAAAGIARATIRRSLLEANSDDALDSDHKSEFVVEDSVLQNNGDDGIEIRLHNDDFAGASVEHVIVRNRITGNGEDGIQLIDYDELTPRSFRIERNLIASNADAGLGMMCNGNSVENFEGCPIPEPVRLVHNTFFANSHGLTGGVNTIGVGNLFVGSALLGVKNVTGGSLLAHSLLHANGSNSATSNLDAPTTLFADPRLGPGQQLLAGSPAIDAGAAFYSHLGEVIVDLDASEYDGPAPDLGAFEHDPNTPPDLSALDVRIAAGSDDAEESGAGAVTLGHGDLGLGQVGSVAVVGMRFAGLAVPQAAIVLAATVQFTADESDSASAALTLDGQAADHAATFSSAAGNVSSRPRTSAAVTWSPIGWSIGAAGPAQQTPDLSAVVQEIVSRPGWASGNALALVVTGSGERVAESFEGAPLAAPLLHVEWVTPGCGNGFVESGEGCDDGNLFPGDGCDASCQPTTACDDGVDQDGDGVTDFPADPGCDAADDDSERSGTLVCDNGVDDDGDGFTDFDTDEDGDGISDPPGDPGCPGPAGAREDPVCQDGLDNDGQLGIDFDGGAAANNGVPLDVADPDCGVPWQGNEQRLYLPGCGLGGELILPLALLGWARSRRRAVSR